MASAHVSDPLTALREFVERITPYDPDPAATVGTVGIDHGHESGEFRLTPHLARALVEALASYRDPADRGTCAGCGGRRLDDNLHCQDCGRLHGVLGAVIFERAERISEQAERVQWAAGTDAERPLG
ncbi:hypothetical protein [Micromonospora polyrhachis]|uniref:Uncharacterized protein n=1 Tax=Micromonospora polyrhachis TaxID=1282883 RepID=A0A7W7SPB0_9ACTN|nr:hypothetical protein [Micromonospora polyrhachis]MBB4958326.1 hypothetical protein [Micromonospora polyrhachis]